MAHPKPSILRRAGELFLQAKDKAAAKRFRNGYDWAAAEMVQGKHTPEWLTAYCAEIPTEGYKGRAFDSGVLTAVLDYQRQFRRAKMEGRAAAMEALRPTRLGHSLWWKPEVREGLAPGRGGDKPRLYLAGPMTGLPEFNYPAFHEEARKLRDLGFTVVSPAEVSEPNPEWTWDDYIRIGLQAMLTCDGVALLPGWQTSKGVQVETQVAHLLRMQVGEVRTWRAVETW